MSKENFAQEKYKILALVQWRPFFSFWAWPRWGAGQQGDLASVSRWLRWSVAGRCLLLEGRWCLGGRCLLLDKRCCLNGRIPSNMDSRFLPMGLQKHALVFCSHNPHSQSGLRWISSSYKISFCKLKRRKKSQQIKTNKLTVVGIKSIWGKWSMNVSNFVNECQHQWRETKVNITGKKMRSKHSLAADKQQNYKIYSVLSHPASRSELWLGPSGWRLDPVEIASWTRTRQRQKKLENLYTAEIWTICSRRTLACIATPFWLI